MKKQNLIAIASLAMLLAGCGGNSDTSKTSTPASTAPTSTTPTSTTTSTSTKPVTPETPTLPEKLTDDDFGYLSTEDLTFTASSTTKVGVSASGASQNMLTYKKSSEIKLGDGLYLENGTLTGTSSSTSSSSGSTSTADISRGFYKNDDGYAYYYTDPDLHNNVTNKNFQAEFDSYFTNPFDATDEFDAILAEDFDYNSRKSKKNTYSTFVLNEDKLEDEDIAAFLFLVDEFSTANTYGMSLDYFYAYLNYQLYGTASYVTASDLTIDHVYLYADYDGLIGIDYKITASISASSTYGTYTYDVSSESSLFAKDIDNTNLTKADVTKTPYTKTAGADSQYSAFDKAIAGFKAANNYALSGYIAESKTKVSGFDLVFVNDEYSAKTYGYNALGTKEDETTVSYSGVHKVSDGVYDIYESDTVAIATGANHTSAPTMPTLDFSSEIFEYDATNSTADDYVFTLRSSYSSSEVLQLISNLLYISTDGSLSVTVSKDGVLKNVSTTYKTSSSTNSSLTNTYTAVFNYSDIGSTTAIPSTLATFTDYVAYKTPTSYAEITTSIYDYDNQAYLSDTNVETVLKSLLGETSYANCPNVFEIYDLGDYYAGTLYSATSYNLVELQFSYDTSNDLSTALTGLYNAFKKAGYTISQTNYGYSISFTGGTLEFGYTTDNGYILFIDIQPTTTSTTSL